MNQGVNHGHHNFKRKGVQKIHTTGLTNNNIINVRQQHIIPSGQEANDFITAANHNSTGQIDQSMLESSFTLTNGNSRPMHATQYGGVRQQLIDISGGGQVMSGSLSTGGGTFL